MCPLRARHGISIYYSCSKCMYEIVVTRVVKNYMSRSKAIIFHAKGLSLLDRTENKGCENNTNFKLFFLHHRFSCKMMKVNEGTPSCVV